MEKSDARVAFVHPVSNEALSLRRLIMQDGGSVTNWVTDAYDIVEIVERVSPPTAEALGFPNIILLGRLGFKGPGELIRSSRTAFRPSASPWGPGITTLTGEMLTYSQNIAQLLLPHPKNVEFADPKSIIRTYLGPDYTYRDIIAELFENPEIKPEDIVASVMYTTSPGQAEWTIEEFDTLQDCWIEASTAEAIEDEIRLSITNIISKYSPYFFRIQLIIRTENAYFVGCQLGRRVDSSDGQSTRYFCESLIDMLPLECISKIPLSYWTEIGINLGESGK